jgi:hypothetical protein
MTEHDCLARTLSGWLESTLVLSSTHHPMRVLNSYFKQRRPRAWSCQTLALPCTSGLVVHPHEAPIMSKGLK